MDNALQVMLSDSQRSPNSPARILNSWKEISAYLGRGIRTVQRYEEELGFPVHRLCKNKRSSSVLAFADEIDFWLRNTPKNSLRFRIHSDEVVGSDLGQAFKVLEQAYAAYQAAMDRYIELKTAAAGSHPPRLSEASERESQPIELAIISSPRLDETS